MTGNTFMDYLPAMLTFIVGILGVIGQLTISFLSEHNRNITDIRSVRRNNAGEYYIPLLFFLREYSYCHSVLKKTPEFTLENRNYPLQESIKRTYERLRRIYSDISALSSCHYIPTNIELHIEIQRFITHVIITNSLWTDKCEGAEFKACLPQEELKGYDVSNLIKLLELEITSIQ